MADTPNDSLKYKKETETASFTLGSNRIQNSPDTESVGSYKTAHCVFNVYRGKFVLIDKDLTDFLYGTFSDIAQEKGFKIIAVNILPDHVHCLIGYPTFHRIDYIMRMLKGISARRLFQNFPTNRYVYPKLWARSYYAKEVCGSEINSAIRYIKDQKVGGIDKRFLRKGTDSFTVGVIDGHP